MSYKTRSGFLSARENSQRERRELGRRLAEEQRKRKEADAARKKAEDVLRERDRQMADLGKRVRRQEQFQHVVEATAVATSRRVLQLKVDQEKMRRAGEIFAAIDARNNPPPESEE